MEFPRIAEVAEQIGQTPQWLRRYLLARQKATGTRVLVDVNRSGSTSRPTYRVDVGAMRRACPELFDARDPIAAALGRWREEVRAELAQTREEIAELHETLALMTQALRNLTTAVHTRR